MKQVFRLNIKIGTINEDFFFEDKETAEHTVAVLEKSLTEKAKKKIKIEASVCPVYNKKSAIEDLIKGLGMIGG
jgi:hypothetical protein